MLSRQENQENATVINLPDILQALNNPSAKIVQRYIQQHFHSSDNEAAYEALYQAVIHHKQPDPAAVCCFALITVSPRLLDDAAIAKACDYAKTHGYTHILKSLEAYQRFLTINDSLHPVILDDLSSTHFVNLRALSLNHLQHPELSLMHAELGFAYLNDSELSYANLSGTCFDYAHLERANLSHSNLQQTSFKHTKLNHTNFSDAFLDLATLDDASGHGVTFLGVNWHHANLRHAEFKGCSFDKSFMLHTDCLHATFTRCTFQKAELLHTNMQLANLTNSSLRGADLSGANFSFANLTGVNLCGANFKTACFDDAIFDKTLFIDDDLITGEDKTFRKLKIELRQLYKQIKQHPNRKILRDAIVDNLIHTASQMDHDRRLALYTTVIAMPLFGHHTPSARKGMNETARLFTQNLEQHKANDATIVPFKSKTQKRLREGLLGNKREHTTMTLTRDSISN